MLSPRDRIGEDNRMGVVAAFYTDTDLDIYGDERRAVYHNQSECEYGKRIKRDHNEVYGFGVNRHLCKECTRLAGLT